MRTYTQLTQQQRYQIYALMKAALSQSEITAMHATEVLGKHFRAHCQGIHRWRMASAMSRAGALFRGRVLTVTGLERAQRGASAPKHPIKRID